MSADKKEAYKLLGAYSTIGMSVVFSIFIGLGIGYYIDNRLFGGSTAPWFTLIFLFFGIAAGYKNIYMLSKRKDL